MNLTGIATVAKARPINRLSVVNRCVGINLDITVPVASFEPKGLAWLLADEEEKKSIDLGEGMISGPLRLGTRGKDDFRIVASIARHDSADEKRRHYHIWLQATATDGYAAPKEWPTVTKFLNEVGKVIREPEASVRVIGEHVFPRADWKGGAPLPLPLTSVTGNEEVTAELTGMEITFPTETGRPRALLTLQRESCAVVTVFTRAYRISSELFRLAIEESAALGTRALQLAPQQTRDDR